MVNGLDIFRKRFIDYKEQYILIGGTACEIIFDENNLNFRATRDLDIVLVLEAMTAQFVDKFWDFIKEGGYRNKYTKAGKPQFYRFDKPSNNSFPKMIELFCRNDIKLKAPKGITPIHINDNVSSLSAILLNDDYYQLLLKGKIVVNGLSILSPEYLILFKAKAYLDLKQRKEKGENVDSNDIKKHKKDIFRITSELVLNDIKELPKVVRDDIELFVASLLIQPYDDNSLKPYGITNEMIVDKIQKTFCLKRIVNQIK